MDNNFKKKILDINEGNDSRIGKPIPAEELKKVIRFGVLGELGENYFLFLYRDFYRNTADYYGAVIMLHKRDELEHPITITCIEQNGKEQHRSVYARAAIFFLQNEFKNTMNISGNAAPVFEMAKKKINEYIGKPSSYQTGDLLEQFDFDIANQTVKCLEMEMKIPAKQIESRSLKNNLNKLLKSETVDHSDKMTLANRVPAKIGINLVGECLDLSGEKTFFFQPVIVPIRNDGKYGKPQKFSKTEIYDYEWLDTSKTIMDFFTQYTFIDSQPGNQRLKINLLNHMYFRKLADEIFKTSKELIFCKWDSQKDFNLMKTVRFRSVNVRFAPEIEKISGSVYCFFLRFTDSKGRTLDARGDYKILPMEENFCVMFTTPDEENWFAVPEEPSLFTRFFDFLNNQPEFFYYDFKEVLNTLKTIESEAMTIQPEPLKRYDLYFIPAPVLNIYAEDERLNKPQRLEIEFDYKQEMKKYIERRPEHEVCVFRKNEEFESRCVDILKHDPLLTRQMDLSQEKRTVVHYYYFHENDWMQWMIERGIKYLEKGFKIYSMKWKRFIGNARSSIKINYSSGVHWLEFKPTLYDTISGAGYEIDIENTDMENNMVVDKKGQLHLVTPEEISKLFELYRYAEYHGTIFRIPKKNYILVQRLYDKRMGDLPELKEILAVGEKLKEFERIPDVPVSKKFRGQLRGYQEEGFKWLSFLNDFGFSGCLADDMGLGKTVQTLALLQTLKDNKKLNTSLLVVPVSAIPNWESEIEKFTPGLTYRRHIGSDRNKENDGWRKKNLIITSYATLRNDIELFTDFEFDYIILDESQNIKNSASQVSKAIKVIKGKNRLALSGTPIENSTLELWSLFDFLIPGFLGTSQWFNRQFAQAIEKDNDEGKADLLKKMIFPFIMRRKKEEVETELPEKIEIVSTLDMEEEQMGAYAETAQYFRDELDKEIDEKGVSGSSMKIMEGMLRLRQICLFPQLANEKFDRIPSAKFNHLKGLLEDILAEKHKALIFSQFVEVLKIIKNHCDDEHIRYSYIDGSVDVNTRGNMVKQFQEEEDTRVFLLSLKAGGVALNLTAADYVIIFDPWWNPAVEAQAIDRSHRIGQTKKVMVYRMVVKESIEEKMLQLQEKKRDLMENIIVSDSNSFKNLKKEDILRLFK